MNICKTLLLFTAFFSSNVGVELKYLILPSLHCDGARFFRQS